jgi:hypothetical protein
MRALVCTSADPDLPLELLRCCGPEFDAGIDEVCVLFTHPIWASELPGGRAQKLIMALQYAVILRTDDRRRWHINND